MRSVASHLWRRSITVSRRRIAGLLLVAVLLAALLAYAASRATSYQEVIEHGPAPQVRSTPYLDRKSVV